ncbi:MAG TPA: class I SAM-dependent methyltransferase, partial [Candidatus Paceibacterota bacterium]
LACGQGFFSRAFYEEGAEVIGVDISEELIGLARKNSPKEIKYYISDAHKLDFIEKESIDKAVIVLAIQNIENPREVFEECNRVLEKEGRLFIVMNHPAFRIPKESGWGWDPDKELEKGMKGVQYRRIDRYLSELKSKIQMHPSSLRGGSGRANLSDYTISFHKPLQFYFKALKKSGFAVIGLEEWVSDKKSEPGPRTIAENRARSEFPLFLMLEMRKI